jgi:hypothetical protein
MIKFILLFVVFLAVFIYTYSLYSYPSQPSHPSHPLQQEKHILTVCEGCGATVKMANDCPMCGSPLNRFRREIYDFQKPAIKHKVGCGCRLCYKNPKDFRDLKEYNWWDFHDTSGERVYAGGTLPLFGLWTNKENLRAPHCLKAKFDWRFNSPCKDPHSDAKYPFPAECNDLGRCRIRGPLEDNIKNL